MLTSLVGDINNPLAGSINTAADARNIQFGVKLIF
jgi:hypothetical protein